jgi:cytoskeletal protein RodZ
MSDIFQIDGQSVRLKRETLGLAVTDLATLACLSTKQIKQIEEGGTSAFYSENVKLTAARKIAALLQMSEAQLFGQVPPAVLENTLVPEDFLESLPLANASPEALADNAEPVQGHHAALLRSEALHVLAQPPEDVPASDAYPMQAELPVPVLPAHADLAPVTEVPELQSDSAPSTVSGGSYMLKILALFLVALAVAAVLRPKAADEKTELSPQESAAPAPPPIQVPAASDTQASTTEGAPATVGSQAHVSAPAEKPLTVVTDRPATATTDNANSVAK